MITVRDRATGFAHQHRYWDDRIIEKVLKEQKSTEDVYITKYPSSRLIDTIILDFDNDENPQLAYNDASRLRRYLDMNGINSVIIDSGNKGNHLYIDICPFQFESSELFTAFVCFLIHDGEYVYETLDSINTNAGLSSNIRLIGSKHPKTGRECKIIEGSFNYNYAPTELQYDALKKASCKVEISHEKKKRQIKARVVGNDPIANNDLRDVFQQIVGEVKHYPKGYAYCCCPFHNDKHPSMLITKEWYSCSGCGEKGNIWTLRKKGLVKFDSEGKIQ